MWSWSAGTISLPGYIMIIVIVPLRILFFVYGILIDIIHYNSSDTLGQTSGACRIPVWECESVRVDACGWREWSSHAATSLPTARHHAPPLCTTLYHTHFHNLRPHFQLSISTIDAQCREYLWQRYHQFYWAQNSCTRRWEILLFTACYSSSSSNRSVDVLC